MFSHPFHSQGIRRALTGALLVGALAGPAIASGHGAPTGRSDQKPDGYRAMRKAGDKTPDYALITVRKSGGGSQGDAVATGDAGVRSIIAV